MLRRLRILIFRPVIWLLGLFGLATLLIAAMVASPLVRPPANDRILSAVQAMDQTGIAPLSRFQARDGTVLAYRLYPAETPQTGTLAIAIHGSAGSSAAMTPLANALAAAGITVAAPDIRGHGASGTRGDIGYIGQLEDDLDDLVAELRGIFPDDRLALIGHSSGGGFALGAAVSPVGTAFERFVLLAPYLGPFAPTSREPEAGDLWASPDVPRIVALDLLARIGLPCCEALPVIAFALPESQAKYATLSYTYRLLTDFGPPKDYQAAFSAVPGQVAIIAGADDALMDSGRYAEVAGPDTEVEILPGLGHMRIIEAPAALEAIVSALKRD